MTNESTVFFAYPLDPSVELWRPPGSPPSSFTSGFNSVHLHRKHEDKEPYLVIDSSSEVPRRIGAGETHKKNVGDNALEVGGSGEGNQRGLDCINIHTYGIVH